MPKLCALYTLLYSIEEFKIKLIKLYCRAIIPPWKGWIGLPCLSLLLYYCFNCWTTKLPLNWLPVKLVNVLNYGCVWYSKELTNKGSQLKYVLLKQFMRSKSFMLHVHFPFVKLSTYCTPWEFSSNEIMIVTGSRGVLFEWINQIRLNFLEFTMYKFRR